MVKCLKPDQTIIIGKWRKGEHLYGMPRICVQGQLNMENTWTLRSRFTDARVGYKMGKQHLWERKVEERAARERCFSD